MTIVQIYCPDCDYEHETLETVKGKPPCCPRCGETKTRHAGRIEEVNPESQRGLAVLWGAPGFGRTYSGQRRKA